MYVDYKKIGVRIAQRRKEIKMKQNTLAEKTNLSNNHISNIENGYSVPSIETFAKICNVLNITPDYLLLGTLKSINAKLKMHKIANSKCTILAERS